MLGNVTNGRVYPGSLPLQAYSTRPKDSATSGFVRGKSVFIANEILAAQLKVNSSQRKEITGCNWGFDFELFSE